MPELLDTSDLSLLDRREFTLQLILAVLSGATITVVSACGGGGGSPASPSPNPGGGGNTEGVTGTVLANHGHTAFIENAKLTAGLGVALDIRGQADHPHTIDLTANQVMQIAARQRVSVESTTDAAHAHTVVFNG